MIREFTELWSSTSQSVNLLWQLSYSSPARRVQRPRIKRLR